VSSSGAPTFIGNWVLRSMAARRVSPSRTNWKTKPPNLSHQSSPSTISHSHLILMGRYKIYYPSQFRYTPGARESSVDLATRRLPSNRKFPARSNRLINSSSLTSHSGPTMLSPSSRGRVGSSPGAEVFTANLVMATPRTKCSPK
jgi:hypothetical protein